MLKRLLALLKELRGRLHELRRATIHREALKYLGTDPTPGDEVDDVLACAHSVTTILNKAMGFPIIWGTWTLKQYLETDPRFKRTGVPMPGDIILSPTGMGNGTMRGHVGIVGTRETIMSNDSSSGKWMANYTIKSWRARYERQGGIKTLFYTRTA